MSSVKIICLSRDGTINEVSIDSNIPVNHFTKNNLKGKTKFTFGNGELERECDYDYNDKFVSIFAFSKGDDSMANKHELPPPIDKNTYYGDIFALYHENEKLINMTLDEYKDFYETAFGGFEDLDDDNDDDEDDEDDSDLDGFIVNDSEADASDYHTSSDETEESNDDDDDTDELLEQYDVYKHYVDSMRKSGKSATKTIQDKLKTLYDELKRRNLL